MTDVDEIIQKLSSESGKTVDEIKSKMQERKTKTHGLLSDYGAVYAVAKELGADLNPGSIILSKINGMKPKSPVNLYGRVKMVFSPREFSRKDGSSGKFASILLLDETGETRLVLWGENTDFTKKTRVGDTILIKNGFVKDNNGVIEVHAGSLTNLSLNPSGIEAALPEVEEHASKIGDLTANEPSVNVVCRVSAHYPKTEFTRKDGSVGARASIIAQDESGKIRAILWDNAASTEFSDGDIVAIENAYTREAIDGGIELQVGSRGRIIKSDKTLNLPPLEKTRQDVSISSLKPGESGFNLTARVLRVYPPRDYEGGSLSSLIVGDETGTTRVVLWDVKSKESEKLARDDGVFIENAYSRTNMSDEVEVHVGKYGSIKKTTDSKLPSASEIEAAVLSEKKIDDLEPTGERVKVSGTIVSLDVDKPLLYTTCPSCSKRVQNLGGTWFCEMCGDVDPDVNMVVSFVLEDDTGNIRAVAFRAAAEKIIGVNIESAMNMMGKSSDESTPLKNAQSTVIETQLSVVGKVKYNDYSDQLEFLVDEAQI